MSVVTNLFSLQDKVALVTGATDGIGLAIASSMVEHGARVIVSSRKAESCNIVAKQLCESGGDAIAIACDVSRQDDIDSLFERIPPNWRNIDILVLNAAVNPRTGPLVTLPSQDYDVTMNVNLRSALHLCNKVIPPMVELGGGSVIMISSIAAVRGSATIGIYSVSKAALSALARSLAVEWGNRNIRVNCIAPGLIRTKLSRQRWEDPKRFKDTLHITPLDRIGEPEDIAGVAILLGSDAGRFITGQTIFVDGGITIGGG